MSMQINTLKIVRETVLTALLAGTAGCFSLENAPFKNEVGKELHLHASSSEPVSHAVVANYGWYLFNLWPLASGNAKEDAKMPFHFFYDDVKEDVLQGRLTKFAKAQQCDVADLALLSSEQVLLSIPGTSLPLPIPYIFTYRRMQISGVLVKHAEVSQSESDAARRRAMSKEMKLLLNEIPNGDNK